MRKFDRYKLTTSVTEDIRYRLTKHNENFIMVISGATGSGKSYAGLRLCESVDPNFDISRVGWKTSEFLNIINNHKLKKGSMVLWDEVGVGIPSTKWASEGNQLLRDTFETFRDMNIGVVLTTPSFKFIDYGVRKLIHAWILDIKKFPLRKYALAKFLWVEWNDRFDKFYYHRPTKIINGQVCKVDYLSLRLPSAELRKAYEPLAKEFKRSVRDKAEKRFEAVESGLSSKSVSTSDIVEEIVKDMDKYCYVNRFNQMSLDDVMLKENFGVTSPRIREISKHFRKNYLERIKEFKECELKKKKED